MCSTSSRRARAGLHIAALCLASLLLALSASAASAAVTRTESGRFIGVAPHARAVSTLASTSTSSGSASGTLQYHGGPVLHSTAPYLVFWDPSGRIASASRSLLARYLTDSAADHGGSSNVWGVERQFTDSTGFADYAQAFGSSQVIVDQQPYPARDTTACTDVATTYPNCVTDAQIQVELTRLRSAESLPAGLGAGAPVYMLVTPSDTNVCAAGDGCTSTTFCAYHSSFGSGTHTVVYQTVPLFFSGASAAQNPKYCQADGYARVQEPNADIADVAVKYLSHELSEAITDPTGTGWWNDSTGNENADQCNYAGTYNPGAGSNPNAFGPALGGSSTSGSLYDQLIAGHQYYTQTEWSNGDSGCDAQPLRGSISAAFTAPTGVLPGAQVTLDPSATTSSHGYSSVTWQFGDGSAPVFAASSSAPAPVTYTYATAGSYTVTMTIVDSNGAIATATRSVDVTTSPVAVFAPAAGATAGSPVAFDGSGSFDGGASIVSYDWDFGDGSAHGAGVTASHTYAAAGTYTVTLTVSDVLGRIAATSHTVTVAVPAPPAPAAPAPAAAAATAAAPGAAAAAVGSPGGAAPTTTKTTRPPRIKKVGVKQAKSGAYLLVTVTGPGVITAGGVRVKALKAGTFRIRVRPTASQRARIARAHSVKIRITISFTPAAGPVAQATVGLALRD